MDDNEGGGAWALAVDREEEDAVTNYTREEENQLLASPTTGGTDNEEGENDMRNTIVQSGLSRRNEMNDLYDPKVQNEKSANYHRKNSHGETGRPTQNVGENHLTVPVTRTHNARGPNRRSSDLPMDVLYASTPRKNTLSSFSQDSSESDGSVEELNSDNTPIGENDDADMAGFQESDHVLKWRKKEEGREREE